MAASLKGCASGRSCQVTEALKCFCTSVGKLLRPRGKSWFLKTKYYGHRTGQDAHSKSHHGFLRCVRVCSTQSPGTDSKFPALFYECSVSQTETLILSRSIEDRGVRSDLKERLIKAKGFDNHVVFIWGLLGFESPSGRG